jgi:hypothetical protein
MLRDQDCALLGHGVDQRVIGPEDRNAHPVEIAVVVEVAQANLEVRGTACIGALSEGATSTLAQIFTARRRRSRRPAR